jgi:hypothetical protein
VLEKFPNVVIFPLIVAQDSQNGQRKSIAREIVSRMAMGQNRKYTHKERFVEEGKLGYVLQGLCWGHFFFLLVGMEFTMIVLQAYAIM